MSLERRASTLRLRFMHELAVVQRGRITLAMPPHNHKVGLLPAGAREHINRAVWGAWFDGPRINRAVEVSIMDILQVPVKNLTSPRQMLIKQPGNVDFEVYTGWVNFNFSPQDSTKQAEVVSFLMLNSTRIRTYLRRESLLDFTVTASPSDFQPEEDEANVIAVTNAGIRLEPQSFAGVAGSPLCLVLRTRINCLNNTFSGITYQVTLLAEHTERERDLSLAPDAAPA